MAQERALAAVLRGVWREVACRHVLLLAAGLAYYALFGLLPGLAAAAALLDMFGVIGSLTPPGPGSGGVVPAPLLALLQEFVTSVPQGLGSGLALAANLVLVTWTADIAASGLLTALNIVYGTQEGRGWLRRNLVALAVGAAGIGLLFVALAVISVPPLLAARLPGSELPSLLWLRWPGLAVALSVALFLLFRYGPNRPPAAAGPVLWGALTAMLLWLLASAGVSWYVARIAAFGKLYGSLAGVAVVLLWLYMGALAMLTGAEVDAVLSRRRV